MVQQAEAADRLNIEGENFAFDRGTMQPVDSWIPKPCKEASFHWVAQSADGYLYVTFYTDGSRLDGPTPLLRRCGWALVATDDAGEVVASAYGVPPEWIGDIAGSEAWALHEAASRALLGTSFQSGLQAVC